MRLNRLCGCALLLAVLASCTPHPSSPTGVTIASAMPTGEPIVALWDGGNYLANIPPSLLFAVWADGSVIRKVHGKLMFGKVSPETIKGLLNQTEQAGFDHPPMPYGIEKPDGPFRCLSVVKDGHASQLHYDGTTDFSDIGPQAYPTRLQCEAFVRMWEQIEKAIATVTPVETKEVVQPLGLKYPTK